MNRGGIYIKPMNDYSFIRGFCYGVIPSKDLETMDKELNYAVRLRLNSTRVWLNYQAYWKDPHGYVKNLLDFVRLAWSKEISVMPILWNGNGIHPDILEPSYRETGDQYVVEIVNALKDEPGIIMWDIMNEPSCNDYILKEKDEAVLAEHYEKMWSFVRYYSNLVKTLDGVNAITIGHTYIKDVEPTVDVVDVISFHDYLSTRKTVRTTYDAAVKLSQKYKKPLINSELACLGRANPYDMALEICEEYNTGWYLFELMIEGYWGDVHGIVYADGTVRDPAIVAAIMGFHRNRTATALKPSANKEGYAEKAIQKVRDALAEKTEVFRFENKSVEVILEAAEYAANLLEACEMVPMNDPPTTRINIMRSQENPDMLEARKLAYELIQILNEKCQLI
jgi:hypothetical protein